MTALAPANKVSYFLSQWKDLERHYKGSIEKSFLPRKTTRPTRSYRAYRLASMVGIYYLTHLSVIVTRKGPTSNPSY